MIEKIGAIKSAKFGFGGYQDCQVVFQFQVGGDGWGTFCTFEGGWAHVTEEELKEKNSRYKWTHEERIKGIGQKAWEVVQLMRDAKVESLQEMVGKPVVVFFEDEFGRNRGFRILKEAILK